MINARYARNLSENRELLDRLSEQIEMAAKWGHFYIISDKISEEVIKVLKCNGYTVDCTSTEYDVKISWRN